MSPPRSAFTNRPSYITQMRAVAAAAGFLTVEIRVATNRLRRTANGGGSRGLSFRASREIPLNRCWQSLLSGST
jgi:hypothetical protein